MFTSARLADNAGCPYTSRVAGIGFQQIWTKSTFLLPGICQCLREVSHVHFLVNVLFML